MELRYNLRASSSLGIRVIYIELLTLIQRDGFGLNLFFSMLTHFFSNTNIFFEIFMLKFDLN